MSDKWRAVFTINSKNIYIGQYLTELEAAQAYDNYIINNGFDKKLNLSK